MIDIGRMYLKLMRTEEIPMANELLKSSSAEYLSREFGSDMNILESEQKFRDRLIDCNSTSLLFLLYFKKSKKLIGYLAVAGINWVNSSAEMSIFIDDKFQKTGLGSMASAALAKYCYEELNIVKLYAKVKKHNSNVSRKAYGQMYKEIPKDDNTSYSYYYAEMIR